MRAVSSSRIGLGSGVIALILVFSASAVDPTTNRVYESTAAVARNIGESLYEALPPKYSARVSSRPVTIVAQKEPMIAPTELVESNRIARGVSVSTGLIDLLNHLSHAKAVDQVEPGFFSAYVKRVASAPGAPPTLPAITADKYWTDDVSNDQLSYFNQMLGFLVALNLSHHYLGHYTKHARELFLSGTAATPINWFLSRREWEKSVRAGAINSCGCAMTTVGARALVEALEMMPERPAWAACLTPPKIDLKRLDKELATYEFDFFHSYLPQTRQHWAVAGSITPRDFGY